MVPTVSTRHTTHKHSGVQVAPVPDPLEVIIANNNDVIVCTPSPLEHIAEEVLDNIAEEST
jgi:hypothetical protein